MQIEPEFFRASEDERPPVGEVRAQLAKILLSGGFVRSERIAELLRYLVGRYLDGPAEPPKESLVGVEVFGRTPGYDTQADPVVRVTARRLRAKLQDYYRGPGTADPVRIELPAGRYAVECGFQASGGQHAMEPPHPLVGPGKVLFDWFQAGKRPSHNQVSCNLPGSPAHPAFSPDGLALAFDWLGPGDATQQIYAQRLDADGPARFSRSEFRESRPAWSPDGGRIAFVRQGANGRFEIRTAPVLGMGDRLLTEVSTHSCAAPRVEWSPDGKVVVTSGCFDSGKQNVLLLVLVEGGAQQQITVPPLGGLGDDEAVFSPEGHMLAFRRRTGPGSGDLYLHPMTGRGPERRLTWDDCEICGLAWAPDGKSLIIASQRGGSLPGLWRISLTRDRPVRLTAEEEAVAWPAVSRRRDRLAYVRRSTAGKPSKPSRKLDEIMVIEDFS